MHGRGRPGRLHGGRAAHRGRDELQHPIRLGGRRIAILAFGSVLEAALAAADEIDASVVNMRYVKPLIAVGGQTVQIVNGDIYVDGERLDGGGRSALTTMCVMSFVFASLSSKRK